MGNASTMGPPRPNSFVPSPTARNNACRQGTAYSCAFPSLEFARYDSTSVAHTSFHLAAPSTDSHAYRNVWRHVVRPSSKGVALAFRRKVASVEP